MANLLLKDGKKKKIELTFLDLYKLEQDKPELAKRYFEVQRLEMANELDMVDVLRVAYVATYGEDISFEDFCKLISNNRMALIECYNDLLMPKN